MSNTPYNSPFEAQFDPDRAQEFIILALLQSNFNSAEMVRVLAVQPTTDRVGFVTVQPLVLEASTGNIVLAQTPIYNVPYLRVQGGVSAIILDPAVGDIGLAVYAQCDITSLKTTLAEGPAPTARAFSTADGLYLGGFLNGAPTQYIRFKPAAAGIDIISPGDITLQAQGQIKIAGNTIVMQAVGNMSIDALLLTINAPTVFNNTVRGTATAGTGNFTFASPITAPDVILPRGPVNNHIHHVNAAPGDTDEYSA